MRMRGESWGSRGDGTAILIVSFPPHSRALLSKARYLVLTGDSDRDRGGSEQVRVVLRSERGGSGSEREGSGLEPGNSGQEQEKSEWDIWSRPRWEKRLTIYD